MQYEEAVVLGIWCHTVKHYAAVLTAAVTAAAHFHINT
jgi:hypothetical protein